MRKAATALAVMSAVACSASTTAGELEFQGVKAPTSDGEKRSILAAKSVRVDGQKYKIDYNTIMRSGDEPEGSEKPFGTLIDKDGNEIGKVSNDNDFSSLVIGDDDGALYMVSHFESRPAAMYLTKLSQDPVTGALSAEKTRPLDFSEVNGGWVHCAGSVTPWGNHLGSEEYPPDAKQWRDEEIDDYNAEMAKYFPGWQNYPSIEEAALDLVNPYDYGFTTEIDVDDYDSATVTKHYAMGRVAIELSYVMPDEKTVYTSDDGSRVGLFMFVADEKGELSSGKLYAAKFTQTSLWYDEADTRVSSDLRDGGAGNLEWIFLGGATDGEIRDIIEGSLTADEPITFEDIFEEDVVGCTWIQNRDASKECLKVVPGMEKAAAFLETSRYAGLMGATTEWEKMEGITLDPDSKTMYLAMSRVIKAMTDGGEPKELPDNNGPSNHMSVPYNYCGTVYALGLDTNSEVGSDFVAQNIGGVVAGIPRLYDTGALIDNPYGGSKDQGPYSANECDLDGISEPDNITFIPGYKTLIIGEDTGKHQNDMIWSYNVDTERLTRIQTTPYGSETTSPYFYPNINGWGYMMSVVQHPFGESDQDALKVPDEEKGYTGYIGPFPAMD
jgi:secreted PhoX family phosphatase